MNKRRRDTQAGIALVAVMLMLMLVAALMAGFTAAVMSEQRLQTVDRDRTQSFYAAHGALEKLTSDLGVLFSSTYAPTGAQINALNAGAPALPGVTYVTTAEGPGYAVTFTPDASGNPAAVARTITAGPYQGFSGLVTPYMLSVTASTGNIGEVRLQRELQTVSIPVFQFGIFSETDLSFFAGPNFAFGGRVHSNRHLFLASGATLTLSDKVSAVGEVVRTNLSNSWPTNSGYTGNVRLITTPGTYRDLRTNEGSVVNTIGSALNEPTWSNLSIGTYHGNVVNSRTGARELNLPLVTIGSTPIEMIKRPLVGEDVNGPLFKLRYFSMASLRILLSDTAATVTNLPSVTAAAPVDLGAATPAWYPVNVTHPPFAKAGTEAASLLTQNSPRLGGVIKIEMQDRNEVWHDVTQEILSLGIGGSNEDNGGCADTSPDAVVRLERVRTGLPAANTCGTAAALTATDLWPNMIYDTREGNLRDVVPATGAGTLYFGGAMNYIELDVRNLSRWFRGEIGASGPQAMDVTGYVVYFSDRRGNRDAAGAETGEYGDEDFVNPDSSIGTPNGVLDTGEDVNMDNQQEVYGRTVVAPVGLLPGHTGHTPEGTYASADQAKMNPPLFFRRALKLTSGTAGNIISPGLTVVAENPVYVEGDYNAGGGAGFGGAHVACSVISDAITLLSNNWYDGRSFSSPNTPGNRPGTETYYRFAVIAGKGPSFTRPTAGNPYQDFGTDGGVHNFLRMLENWGGTIHYRGSIASFYFNRQAVGTYKCCTTVYSPNTRDYQFDIDFLTPALLPPRTPMFRDVNTLGFTQILTPPR